MSDARAELIRLRPTPTEFTPEWGWDTYDDAYKTGWEEAIDAILARPDVVLRALGGTRLSDHLDSDNNVIYQRWTIPPASVPSVLDRGRTGDDTDEGAVTDG